MNETVNILVVDDNHDLTEILVELLGNNGYGVSAAHDGKTAIEIFARQSFDLAILDYKLPDMDGLDLQKRLAEQSDADYIIITAHASIESAAAAVQRKQIIGYETKPLDMNRLLPFVQQVVERRRSEQELEKANARLKAVFQAIPGHISVSDQDFKLIDANTAPDVLNKLGFNDVQEIIGRKCHEIFKNNPSVCPECNVPGTIKSGRIETRFSTSTEDELLGNSTKIYTAPVRDKYGGIIGAVECAMDITDLKEMEIKLRKAKDAAEAATRAKSEFLADMSHEIRTPLNAMVGMSHILKDTPLNTVQREYLDIILASSDMLLAVINDILDFSKIEAGKIELEMIDFNLGRMIRDVVSIASIKAKEKNIRLHYEIKDGVCQDLSGDMVRLRQVILNLVGNAVKFTDQGEIRIMVSAAEDTETHATLRFSVQDTGMGIPQDQVNTLFKPFSQADASISRQYGGSGLGLSISKKIVEMMGGLIGIRSEPGAGSVFWFTVVLEKQTGNKARDNAAQKPAAPCLNTEQPVRILVAEDNPFNQRIIKIMLDQLGIAADIAGNGLDAVRMLKKASYDLVLMDIQMPVMDGVAAAKTIRDSDEKYKKIPIIALTADAVAEDRKNWLASGMNDYLIKPVKPEVLQEMIFRHLQKTKAMNGGVDHRLNRSVGAIPCGCPFLGQPQGIAPTFGPNDDHGLNGDID